MDRHSSWSGAIGAGGMGGLGGAGGVGGRGRRVPPRAGQRVPPRRRGARAATGDGARRWWWLSLGALATALLLLPQLALGQGVRSRTAAVTLTVTAPAGLRTAPRDTSTPNAARRGPSVADGWIPVPTTDVAVARIELHAESLLPAGAGDRGAPLRLFVRDRSGALRDASAQWITIGGDTARATTGLAVRAVAADGAPIGAVAGAARWRVHWRLVPHDDSAPPLALSREWTLGTPR